MAREFAPMPDAWTVLGVSPFGRPDSDLVAELGVAGAVGVLDLGSDPAEARNAVRRLRERAVAPFGLRVGRLPTPVAATLSQECGDALSFIIAEDISDLLGFDFPHGPAANVVRLVEVSDVRAARAARDGGADGLVLCGSEAAGAAGELGAFALLQQVLAEDPGLPVWVKGGLGPHTAAGAIAVGAAGVVLDAQWALLEEADTPVAVRRALTSPAGASTVVGPAGRVLDTGPGHGLPAPVDAAWTATAFARRHRTVSAAVTAVRTAIDGRACAAVTGALHPERALPVAQGPMTRVSDGPEFADAVAEHGGLPFVAVSLSDGPATEDLLGRTAALLGDRLWGAGVLGFVDEELHRVQMAAVRAARPSAVLLAGGRPGQAAGLEADGIRAYLHAPSPVLLEQFLAAGARRFVFEGSECGGHLGPWPSLPLWEAQLGIVSDHLDRHPDAELEIYLAGGVHDPTSAAFVSAATASLARRNVRVGVLMGTAYLFTDEAVRCGAITEEFRRQAVRATRTAVVETAPGHRTRCLDTPFVGRFHDRAAELAELPARERWNMLEEFNTGRLRIASKGIRRDGAKLFEVGTDEQVDDGMYMAGQVAVLRDRATDIATLHREVTDGAAALLAARPAAGPRGPARTTPVEAPLDVAIVGMACAFGAAPDLDAFRALVLDGTDAVTEIPAERFDADLYHGAGSTSRWGAFLPPVEMDPLSYGIPPTSMTAIDPAQLVSLEIARRALHDAGYARGGFDRERAGVIFGAEAGSDLSDASTVRALLPAYLEHVPEELLEQLPRLTEDSFPGTLSNVISGRIANRLDLGGTNYTVDAACGSSLAAVAAACRELTTGAADVMLCGAVDLHNGINDYLLFSSVGALSPTGRCRPFDATADGIALGEGVACLVLKRLDDAVADRDRIHAVIRGLGAASDGRSLGLTAPRPEGQRRALERAYAQAGVSPSTVGLVEAHGTGTVVGDGTELTTLTDFFVEHGARPGTCGLGSVKSQIGHTKCAAGLAGMIRTTVALTHGIVPPTLHLSEPHGRWDRETSPFTFATTARPWATPREQRVAGVSAFGFGGTNFHAVLTAGPVDMAPQHTTRRWPVELLLVRGHDDAAAARDAGRLLDCADRGDLADLAHTAAELGAHTPAPWRWAVVARDLDEARAALGAAIDGTEHPALLRGTGAEPGRVAFLFSGQGSQRTGMLAELFLRWPRLRGEVEPSAQCLDVVHPAATFDATARRAADATLRDTRHAQPALGTTELALLRWLRRFGIEPELLAGHSYGELVALTAAGVLDPAELERLSARRADAVLGAVGDRDPGAMAAIRADATQVRRALGGTDPAGDVVLANLNSPLQTVVSGPTDAIDRAVATLRENGLAARRIEVACAFHSPLVAAGSETFAVDLAAATVAPPRLPVYANRSAEPYPEEPGRIRAELAAQVGSPVRWAQTVEALHRDGARTFVEVGPGKVLTGLVGEILADRPHTAVATGATGDLPGLLRAVAALAVAGVELDPGWLFRGRACRDLRTAAAPARSPWAVDGRSAHRTDGTVVAGALVRPTRIAGGTMSNPSADDRHRLVADYLAAHREMVAAQRDVLLGFLGAAPAGPLVASVPSTPSYTTIEAAPVAASVPRPVEPARAAAPAAAGADPADDGTGAGAGSGGTATPVVDVRDTVLTVIGERTGYPAEMLDDGLDLEADLSIDSIKRTEIAGVLVERTGLLGALSDGDQDELTRLRTIGTIVPWLSDRLGNDDAAGAATTAPVEPVAAGGPTTGSVPAGPSATDGPGGTRPQRHLLVEHDLGAPACDADLTGRRADLVGDPADLDAVRAALNGAGVSVAAGSPEGTDGVDLHLDLTALTPGEEPVAPQIAEGLRRALGAGARGVVVVSRADDDGLTAVPAAGLRGLVRTIGAEYPDVVVRSVELAPGEPVGPALVEELGDRDAPTVVRRGRGGRRRTVVADPVAPATGTTGTLPEDAVLLVLGGARGITARAVAALAGPGRRIELAGRHPHPGDSPVGDPGGDDAALRRAFATDGVALPEIEGRVGAVLANREITATLEAVQTAGAQVGYHVVNVRDAGAVHQLVKEVHNRHGRIDAVVLAAGVISDRLLVQADPDSWARVFGTKADGARAVFAALDQLDARPRVVVGFGSVAAVQGNAGQTDYAAGNDALATLGARWAHRTGARVVTVHWGPWAPGSDDHPGMVSPELARDYARRGVGLIEPTAGVEALVAEIEHGAHEVREVLYVSGPEEKR